MATLTVQDITVAGLEAAYTACAGGGDVFPNDGKCHVEIVNASGGDITLTIATPATIEGVAIADPTVVITAGERRHVGPFNPSIFNNSSGQVALTYSGVTTLTIAVLRR